MDRARSCVEFVKTSGKEPGVERELEQILRLKMEMLADKGKVLGRETTAFMLRLAAMVLGWERPVI